MRLPRLVTELQDALDACSERQRQLEESLRVSRRLLQAWYADPRHPDRATLGIMQSPRGWEVGPSHTLLRYQLSAPHPLSLSGS
jgi:hypothetical protein